MKDIKNTQGLIQSKVSTKQSPTLKINLGESRPFKLIKDRNIEKKSEGRHQNKYPCMDFFKRCQEKDYNLIKNVHDSNSLQYML